MLGLDNFWLNIGTILVGASMLSYLIIKAVRQKRTPVPKQSAMLRVTNGATMFRSQFLGVRPDGWSISTPIQRNTWIPLKPGDLLTIETIHNRGIAIYRTTLKYVSKNPSMIVVEVPSIWQADDRRDEERITTLGHLESKLDGHRVGILDISTCGARLNSQEAFPNGQRVRLDVVGLEEPISGWVLASDRRGDRFVVRLRFEEILDLEPLLQKKAS